MIVTFDPYNNHALNYSIADESFKVVIEKFIVAIGNLTGYTPKNINLLPRSSFSYPSSPTSSFSSYTITYPNTTTLHSLTGTTTNYNVTTPSSKELFEGLLTNFINDLNQAYDMGKMYGLVEGNKQGEIRAQEKVDELTDVDILSHDASTLFPAV